MNWVSGHLCAHIGQIDAGEPSEDDEMKKMTLPSKHNIRNSNPGGMRSRTIRLGHGGCPQYKIFTSERGRNSLFL